jgi:hypothetical protein
MEDAQFDFQWGVREKLPDGEIRWRVDLRGAGEDTLSQFTEETSLPFAIFGISPNPGSRFLWRLTGEGSQPGEAEWQPFCEPSPWGYFTVGARPPVNAPPWTIDIPEVPTPTPMPTPTPTPTPTTCIPMATAFQNATCRFGPDQMYVELGYLLQGESAVVEGRDAAMTWWWIVNPDAAGHCWVWSGLVDVTCDPRGLPVIAAPPTPTPTDLPGCMVRPLTGGAPICVVPCPEDAAPGDPCTP